MAVAIELALWRAGASLLVLFVPIAVVGLLTWPDEDASRPGWRVTIAVVAFATLAVYLIAGATPWPTRDGQPAMVFMSMVQLGHLSLQPMKRAPGA